MRIKQGELYLLKTGPVVKIIEESDMFVHYLLNGMPAKVLKKHFEEMVEREWSGSKTGRPKRKRYNDEFK